MFPRSIGCSLPSLPKKIYAPTLFTTAEQAPRIAVCGGQDDQWKFIASCFVLDQETKTWKRTMGNLPQPRAEHSSVTLKNIGTYLIGGRGSPNMGYTTTFLPSRSQHWVSGPMVPTDMVNPCSIEISERSFLAIQYANIALETAVLRQVFVQKNSYPLFLHALCDI